MEENLQNLEQRFRDEIALIESHHNEKLKLLLDEMDNQQRKSNEQITKLIDDYEKQLEKSRTTYETELDILKNDQRAMIENIRQTKLLEFAVVHESGSYLGTLKNASSNLETATENLQAMRTNIDSNIERIHAEREIQLNAKEKRLNGKLDHSYQKTIILLNISI